MEAVQAVDSEGYGVEYMFICQEDGNFSSGWQQNADEGEDGYVATPWIYDVTGLTLGETYTFTVKTRDRSVAKNETELSIPVEITMAEVDSLPPYPTGGAQGDNPTHESAPVLIPSNTKWQVVLATIAEDENSPLVFDAQGVEIADVEYRFICSDSSFSSGGSQDDGPVWRSVESLAGLTSSFDGSDEVPYRYIINIQTTQSTLTWWIFYRDRSVNQNVTDFSSEGECASIINCDADTSPKPKSFIGE